MRAAPELSPRQDCPPPARGRALRARTHNARGLEPFTRGSVERVAALFLATVARSLPPLALVASAHALGEQTNRCGV